MTFGIRESRELDLFIYIDGKHVYLRELIEALPHGSGVDADWDVQVRKALPSTIRFYNSYHHMNDSGMYCCWKDFHVRLFQHKRDVRNPLKGNCAGKVQILHRKGDWDFKIVGLPDSGHTWSVGDWAHEGVYDGWSRWAIGKTRQEYEKA